jgi:hypothetical protein
MKKLVVNALILVGTILAIIFLLNILSLYYGYGHKLSKNLTDIQVFTTLSNTIDLDTIIALPIKATPESWKYIPFLLTDIASTVYPNIYLPQEIYNDVLSDNPSPDNLAIVIHEMTHLERQKATSPLWWNLKYIVSKKFRLREELFAIANEMQYRVKNNLDYDIDRKARHFSSSVYGWAATYDDAQVFLGRLWQEIQD